MTCYLSVSFPGGSDGKESACNAGDARDMGSTPGLGRSTEVRNGNPLQYSYLENSMDRRAWQTAVHGVSKSRTALSTAEHALFAWFGMVDYR